MDVVIAGGHGQIALRLARVLAARADRVRGLIRNPDHADDVRAAGAEPVLCDLEAAEVPEIAAAVDGAEAIVFAAGAGAGSGAERKATMDRDGAVKTIAAAQAARVDRYIMISAISAAAPPQDGGVFGAYLRAKAAADEAVRHSGLAWTIVRPGGLTDEPGTGRVLAAPTAERGEIPRDDVAAVIAEVLAHPGTSGVVFDVVGGEVPVADAVAALVRG